MLSKDIEPAILSTQARKIMFTNFCYRGLRHLEWYCTLTIDACVSFNTYTVLLQEIIVHRIGIILKPFSFLMKPPCYSGFSEFVSSDSCFCYEIQCIDVCFLLRSILVSAIVFTLIHLILKEYLININKLTLLLAENPLCYSLVKIPSMPNKIKQ